MGGLATTANLQPSWIRDLGRWLIEQARVAVEISSLPYAALKACALEHRKARRIVLRAVAHQVYFTAVQPLSLFAFLSAVSGVLVIAACDRLFHSAGLDHYVEIVATKGIVRELLPIVLALVLTGRSGPAITTELGYMRVNHEIDGLESIGINLEYFVVLPRIFGVTLASVTLIIAMTAAGLLGGYLVGSTLGLISSAVALSSILSALDISTGLIALAKSLAFGVIVSTVSCYHGLAVGRSHTDIPRANARATVLCYALCFTVAAVTSLLTVWTEI